MSDIELNDEKLDEELDEVNPIELDEDDEVNPSELEEVIPSEDVE